MKRIIIEQPALQSGAQKLIYGVLTLFAWCVWLYITWPFLGIVAHLLGINLLGQAGFGAAGAALGREITMVALWCGFVVIFFALFFAVWIVYHRLRFGDGKRRKYAAQSSTQAAVEMFNVPEDVVARMQAARRIVFRHGEAGSIEQVELRIDLYAPVEEDNILTYGSLGRAA